MYSNIINKVIYKFCGSSEDNGDSIIPKIKWTQPDNIEKVIFKGNLHEVREELANIDYNDGISIITTQPGTGKSHFIKKLLKKQKSFILVTGTHKLLENEYDLAGVKYWKGFDRICTRRYEKDIKKMKESGVPIYRICKSCYKKNKDCAYQSQFRTKKAVSPFHYLNTPRVYNERGKNKGDFKFDFLVIDESMLFEFDHVSIDKDEIAEAVKVICKYSDAELDLLEMFLNGLDSVDLSLFNKLYPALVENKGIAIDKALEEENWDDISKISKLDLNKIKNYLYYDAIYGYRESYPVPLVYKVFDIARQGVPIVLLDATFDEEAFNLIYARYCFEDEKLSRSELLDKKLDPVNYVKTKIYESSIIDKGTKIYRINSKNNYYNSGFFKKVKKDKSSQNSFREKELSENGKKTVDEIKGHIKRALRKHSDVAVITTADLEPHFRDSGVTVLEHFHNLKGLNIAKNVGALFIVCTPPFNQKEEIELYNNLCLINLAEDDFYFPEQKTIDGEHYWVDKKGNEVGEIKISKDSIRYGGLEKKKPRIRVPNGYNFESKFIPGSERLMVSGKVDLFIDYAVTDFQYNRYDNEIYQAVMRARLFRDKKKEGNAPEVFMYCYVPDVLEKEFDVKVVNRENAAGLFMKKYLGVYPVVLFDSVNKYARLNATKDTNRIARAFNIKKKDGKINGQFVKEMREASMKDIERIDEAIRKDAKTVNAVRRKYSKSIGVSDEFIEYCIYYARKVGIVKIL